MPEQYGDPWAHAASSNDDPADDTFADSFDGLATAI
jgi:hypothetical protein